MLLLRTTEGALGVVEATKIATGTEDELRFEIHGERGALRFNSMQPHYHEHCAMEAPDHPHGGQRGWIRIDCGQRYGAPAAAWASPKFSIGWIRTHVACLAAFIEAIEERRRPTPGLGQGLYLQYLIEQARERAKARAWRTLKPKAALLRELGM